MTDAIIERLSTYAEQLRFEIAPWFLCLSERIH